MAKTRITADDVLEAVAEISTVPEDGLSQNNMAVNAPIGPIEEAKPLLTIEDYIKLKKPHMGLVASLKVELLKTPEGLNSQTEDGWDAAFEKQKSKVYK